MSKVKLGETLRRSVRIDNSEDTAAEYDISAVANIEGASIITWVEGEVKTVTQRWRVGRVIARRH